MLRIPLATRGSRPATRGLTLVEILISMAVTLLMMAAVVNLFANIGSGVRNRRASMELGTQLRTARARLFKDLAGATCPARPKLPSDDHDDGYLELIEGQFSDKNPSALVDSDNIDEVDNNNVPIGLQHQSSLVPRDNEGRLVQWTDGNENDIVDSTTERNSVVSTGNALGDYDDILALTVRSESEPFVGRYMALISGGNQNDPNDYEPRTIESDLAEVIWYSVENPADGSLGEPGMRTVYRRVLLIAPWLSGQLEPTLLSLNATATPPIRTPQDLLNFYSRNDISVRRTGVGAASVWVPNTLSDLTRRQNRFAHFLQPNFSSFANNALERFGYPYAVDQQAIRAQSYNPDDTLDDPTIFFGPLRPFGPPFNSLPDSEERQGEEVMLNDVLSFDLRVFDPGAPLFEYRGVIVEPTAGNIFRDAVNANTTGGVTNASGFGAYVDLGWDDNYDYNHLITAGAQTPLFQEERQPGYHLRNPGPTPANPTVPTSPFRGTPAVYDTWSYHYEDDGNDQDNIDADNDIATGADEGTDGLDNLNPAFAAPLDQVTIADEPINGVDDALEREAPPPYDTPLRGMQVKIRVYDRDARQIREATVTRSFVPQ